MNRNKSLNIPRVEQLGVLDSAEALINILDEHGIRRNISSLNWPEEFPYRPLATFATAHDGKTLWIDFLVRCNYLRAENYTDQSPVSQDSCVEVFLKPEEVSLAIGKGGLNIKLASMLTEYTIDVFRELDEAIEDEDIYLDEFRDEIDGWVIDAIKAIGIDTAKAVLNAPREMLIEKTDLEEETVDEVLRILKQEFEEEEQ